MDNSNIQDSISSLKVISLNKIHDPLWASTGHEHDHFELVYVKRGSADFETSEETVNLAPHSIVIIKPHQLHKFTITSRPCELLVLSFFVDAENVTGNYVAEITDIISSLAQRPHIILTPGPKNAVLNALKRIIWAKQHHEKWDEFLIYLLMLELLVYISREILSSSGFSGKEGINDAMIRARDYILENYNKQISIPELCNFVYLSESYFSHTFKARFGLSPKNFILTTRINKAKELLSSTDLKINEIAEMVGFSSQQRFNDAFKRLENLTPLKYRKNSISLLVEQETERNDNNEE